jgi:hypothetical protein
LPWRQGSELGSPYAGRHPDRTHWPAPCRAPDPGGTPIASRLSRLLFVAGALALPVGLVACGSDAGSSSTTERSSVSEGTGAESSDEDDEAAEGHEIVPDSEVTAGLAELQTMGAAVVAAANSGKATTADVDAMFDKWATFEGTIKQNEVDLYLTMEDSLAGLRAAVEKDDGPAATTSMKALSGAAAAYLAKHP